MTAEPSSAADAPDVDDKPARRHTADDGRPVLPRVSSDERDLGWGDGPSERDDDWYLRERPPHHG